MIFKLRQDPYDCGEMLFKKNEIELHPGLTVLVGCNGSGKTTLLRSIKERLRENNLPCYTYNNLTSGGKDSISRLFYYGQIERGAALLQSSEGESIIINLGEQARLYHSFIKTGVYDNMNHHLKEAFGEAKTVDSNKRFLLFDAIDSGLSIDMVLDLKTLFNQMIKDAEQLGKELYIIVSANEYELCSNEQCFDIVNGEYITFKTYSSFKKFILKSREIKMERLSNKIPKKHTRKKRSMFSKGDRNV